MSVCKVGLSLIFMYIHILPFLTIYLSLPNSLGDLLFLLRFLLLSLPNNVWRLLVFAPFLIIIKSPKHRLETYCFCSVSYYYYYSPLSFFPWTMNLSMADLRNYWTEFHEKIQHCPISLTFDMWVDNDVPNWFLTLKIFQDVCHFQNDYQNMA